MRRDFDGAQVVGLRLREDYSADDLWGPVTSFHFRASIVSCFEVIHRFQVDDAVVAVELWAADAVHQIHSHAGLAGELMDARLVSAGSGFTSSLATPAWSAAAVCSSRRPDFVPGLTSAFGETASFPSPQRVDAV